MSYVVGIAVKEKFWNLAGQELVTMFENRVDRVCEDEESEPGVGVALQHNSWNSEPGLRVRPLYTAADICIK